MSILGHCMPAIQDVSRAPCAPKHVPRGSAAVSRPSQTAVLATRVRVRMYTGTDARTWGGRTGSADGARGSAARDAFWAKKALRSALTLAVRLATTSGGDCRLRQLRRRLGGRSSCLPWT